MSSTRPGQLPLLRSPSAPGRYADEHDYDAWEALWSGDETIIWLPEGHLTQLLDPSAGRRRDV
jgi:hypothetical protein